MINKTLVILPGWGGSHETWADFAFLAKEKFEEVKVIDLPCFGDEPCPNQVWGIPDYSKFVKSKIIDSRNSESKIILFGHSFGGAVATHFAAHNPDAIEKLILSGPSVFRTKKTARKLFFCFIAKCGKIIFKLPIIEKFDVLAKKLLYRAADSPDYLKTSGIKRDIFKKIIKEDLTEILPRITTPALVLWGSEDSFVPLDAGKEICKLIPNSKLVIFQSNGHGLHLKAKHELMNQITKFAK